MSRGAGSIFVLYSILGMDPKFRICFSPTSDCNIRLLYLSANWLP
jgi:hypothetical protein